MILDHIILNPGSRLPPDINALLLASGPHACMPIRRTVCTMPLASLTATGKECEGVTLGRRTGLLRVDHTSNLNNVIDGNHIAYDHHPRPSHPRPLPTPHTPIMKITQTRTFQ